MFTLSEGYPFWFPKCRSCRTPKRSVLRRILSLPYSEDTSSYSHLLPVLLVPSHACAHASLSLLPPCSPCHWLGLKRHVHIVDALPLLRVLPLLISGSRQLSVPPSLFTSTHRQCIKASTSSCNLSSSFSSSHG